MFEDTTTKVKNFLTQLKIEEKNSGDKLDKKPLNLKRRLIKKLESFERCLD